jgi:demethylmenaquinone methyltransferase/2-methoxy-6-polyprenyl-1,4-benzoquinol methylase
MSNVSKTPHKIQSMFSAIAPRYDLLNRLLSLGKDRYWRSFAVRQLPKTESGRFLDVATGTGDVAIEIARQYPGARITGMDFSDKMLELGREKIRKTGLDERIDIRFGDVTSLQFDDRTFDAAIIAFGIRNIPDYKKGIREMARVLRDGGRIVILEFTTDQNRFFRGFFRLYLEKVLPFIGGIISGRKSAYKYLSDSVLDFPDAEQFKKIMEEAGLKDVRYHKLTFSIVTVHVGTK